MSPTDSPTVTLMPAESPAATCAEPAQTKIDLSICAPDLSSAFTGDAAFPAERFRYKVPALEAGQYLFQCDIHPRDMEGPLIVQ